MRDGDRGIVDWPPPRRPRQRTGLIVLAVLAAAVLFGGGTALSYYVDAVWFGSLGYSAVFWRSLNIQAAVFIGFAVVTFLAIYGSYVLLKPARLGEIGGGSILINGQPLTLPVEPVLRLIAIAVSVFIAVASGAGMMAEWSTLALYWYARGASGGLASQADPIFGRPVSFYLFSLPAWELVSGWLLTLAIIVCLVAVFFIVVSGGARMLNRGRADQGMAAWRGLSVGFGVVLLMLAVRVYLGRFGQLLDDRNGAIFSGVDYTHAHITLPGLLIVAGALALGALVAFANTFAPRLWWLVASVVPAMAVYAVVAASSWYVDSFIVKPNELVRETPYIAHNIEFTRLGFALDRLTRHPFAADAGVGAVDPSRNKLTLDNIRLWDWRALQDTLRQIQEIRTYYDFPDIDIDRYRIDGGVREMMLAVRELNVNKLPESSQNWINTKLIYTHGYGVTMNPVNGFTPEGLPNLVLSNMPVESTIPSIKVTRPEIYFGQLTDTDVYVKTHQKEFNYPQGETNNLNTYQGTGGIVIGNTFRRLLLALEEGDVAKLPFSDDVTPDSRLLMRRNVSQRVSTLAPFLLFDPDPYIVVGDDGHLSWIIDGFTTSDSFPYAREYMLGNNTINYLRNSVKAVVDAYDGTTTFYVFDPQDPIIAAYRGIFPSLFKDASAMPAGLRRHVRYPELMLKMQAAVYGLYHMTSPEVFYNREDLWTVASEVATQGQQQGQPMDPNYVLMTLPGETQPEFVGILPFTPANRNNLIGWIGGRSDEPNYGTAVVYDFPKTKLIDGPLQIEARIDQNSELSGQLSLWNQQGSHVVRGTLIVIPIGRALLYAEPIYLQAQQSPMPELRLVVLALQDRLAYAPTFQGALDALFGNAQSTLTGVSENAAASEAPPVVATAPAAAAGPAGGPAPAGGSLAAQAARDLADYQRLTAEGKMGEAGQKLESLQRTIAELNKSR